MTITMRLFMLILALSCFGVSFLGAFDWESIFDIAVGFIVLGLLILDICTDNNAKT